MQTMHAFKVRIDQTKVQIDQTKVRILSSKYKFLKVQMSRDRHVKSSIKVRIVQSTNIMQPMHALRNSIKVQISRDRRVDSSPSKVQTTSQSMNIMQSMHAPSSSTKVQISRDLRVIRRSNKIQSHGYSRKHRYTGKRISQIHSIWAIQFTPYGFKHKQGPDNA